MSQGNDGLDLVDRRILHALYLQPRSPFSHLAEVLGLSEQTIARRYRQLSARRIARVVGQLRSERLGRSDWAVRIRCVPGAALGVARSLAEHPDSAWVSLTAGGTEIAAGVHHHRSDGRAPLLLDQLAASRHIVDVQAFCFLKVFTDTKQPAPLVRVLDDEEVARLSAGPALGEPRRRPVRTSLRDADWPLVDLLREDGRATFRSLAERTHWHETTVRQRVLDLVAAGILTFEVDLDPAAVGLGATMLLAITVPPIELERLGRALAARPDIPFVAATTGPSNLFAGLLGRDNADLYRTITTELVREGPIDRLELVPVHQTVKLHSMVLEDRHQSGSAWARAR
ncbi:Lrp/AsnC family transcriptional regulator [Aciditerrimonas ferrireducens]|uniref:Lrp/AsnC family transcriptional regulator n=1 Tax=Aciditerrimonas ferrireducens TaxID=667306 RepID=A0ABV6C4C9_9ACTN